MSEYPTPQEADAQVESIKAGMPGLLQRLHPTDKARAYRKLEAWTGKKAEDQEELNDRDGVPERPSIINGDERRAVTRGPGVKKAPGG